MRNRTTAEALRRILQSFALDLHVALPGIVRSYDPATQTAEVEPAVQRVIPAEDEDAEADTAERLPILPSVPVAWPSAGGYFLHWPLTAGDSVMLVFAEQDINAWRESGDVSDPGVSTRHGLAGAVAVPGLRARSDTLGSAGGTYGRVGRDGGPYIEFRPTEIHAGGTKALAEHPNLDSHLSAIAGDLATIAAGLSTPIAETALNYGPITGKPALDTAKPIPTSVLKGD